jgi:hypothetical protein
MKKILQLIAVFAGLTAGAQAPPQGINYQAVARDNSGSILANSTISIKFSIVNDLVNNVTLYQETHTNVVTNQFGLFSLVIGQGAQSGGTLPNFTAIPWGTVTPYLKVEANPGTGFIDMGTMKFWSVPYAMYAGNGGGGGATGPTGPPGVAGLAGQNGSTGPQGPAGPAGPTGQQGQQGLIGPGGAAGPTGPQGQQGAQGPAGAAGSPGAQGPQGNVGPTGPGGINGAQGPTGSVGPTGPTGNNGLTGATGPTGQSLTMDMFSPVDFASGGASTSWTTYNAASFLPVGTRFVIVEGEAAMSGPDGGDNEAHIRFRSGAGQPSFILLKGRSAGQDDVVSWAGQGIFPVSSNRTFDYIIESPGFDGGYTLRIVGYIQ